jgi:hypothetical protein
MLLLGCCCVSVAAFSRLSRTDQQAALALFCLVLLGMAEELLIGLGRLRYGVNYAAASRYSTLTMVAPAASMIFLAWHADKSRTSAVLSVVLGTAICIFSLLADNNEIAMANARRQYGENLQRMLRAGRIGADELRQLQWGNEIQGGSPQDIQNGIQTLQHYRLSLYHAVPN